MGKMRERIELGLFLGRKSHWMLVVAK